ncbi:CHAT domain-containing protein [Phlebopus sp. FC_14]|nr:CHAT domain-containing protein [Phlebopus sp. FC_14]
MPDFDDLVRLADELYARFEAHGNLSDLSLAIVYYRSALTLAGSNSTLSNDIRSKLLGNLANVLSIRFQRHGDMADLAHSLECHLAALDLRPPGHPGRASTLSNFATALLVRYEQLGVERDIELAIEHFSTALSILSPNDPARLMPLMNYASALFSRFQSTGDISDLNHAISQYRAVVDSCPPENRATSYYNLANALLSRFKLDNDPSDLDLSIEYSCVALHLLKDGREDHPLILAGLATGLIRRFELRGDTADLEAAINNYRAALDLRPAEHPRRFNSLNDLADALIMRYKHRGSLPDLELAIDYYRQALRLLPSGHHDEGMLLDNLGNALFLRLTRLGDLGDLEEAIDKHVLALELHARNSSRRVVTLEALATCLDIRFEQRGDPTDLRTAIDHYNEALFLAPEEHPHCATILNNMASSLETRFRHYGDISDLNRCISYCREVLDLLPLGHPDRAVTFHSLAGALLSRFEQRGDEFDLDQAYLHCSTSLNMRAAPDPARAACELLLARILKARFLPWGDPKDLEPIFQHLRTAKDFCTTSHPLLLDVYAELASAHFLRYLVEQRPADLKEAFGHHELSLNFTGGTSWPAFRASLQWIRDSETFSHPSGVDAYRNAMRLLDRHVLLTPSLELRQCFVRRHVAALSVEAASCAVRHNQPDEAIEILEQGRMMLWSHLARALTPLDDLRATGQHGASLADEFERLSAQLERIPRISSTASKSCRLLLKERDTVVEQIRRIHGFKHFFLRSHFLELQKAASDGPVIIVNASQYTCDAVIVLHTGPPIHVPLPQITLRDVTRMAARFQALTTVKDEHQERRLADLLSDLWDQVVYPIIQKLVSRTPRGSRLWWCPTGKFTAIPLHAAGPYRSGEPSLSQVYVSSYTSTIHALSRSRTTTETSRSRRTSFTPSLAGLLKGRKAKQQPPPPPRTTAPTVIGIGRPRSEESSDQLSMVRNRIPPSIPFKSIEGEEVTAEAVLDASGERAWVHFACSAFEDLARPFKSGFALREGELTVCDFAKARLQADFAFVPACQNIGEVSSTDEFMHLAACLQFCGFKSVVGTMWPVDEEVSRRLVSAFYENVMSKPMNPTDVARALNDALRQMDDDMPLAQKIAFVHIGV